jgi:hypothetical protein
VNIAVQNGNAEDGIKRMCYFMCRLPYLSIGSSWWSHKTNSTVTMETYVWCHTNQALLLPWLHCHHGIIHKQMLFVVNAVFMCRCNGLAVIYSVHKTMQQLQLLRAVCPGMHGKEKRMKSISGALSRH